MVYVDAVSVTPNSVNAGKTFNVTVEVHEEYENSKKYLNKYPYRYGEQEET